MVGRGRGILGVRQPGFDLGWDVLQRRADAQQNFTSPALAQNQAWHKILYESPVVQAMGRDTEMIQGQIFGEVKVDVAGTRRIQQRVVLLDRTLSPSITDWKTNPNDPATNPERGAYLNTAIITSDTFAVNQIQNRSISVGVVADQNNFSVAYLLTLDITAVGGGTVTGSVRNLQFRAVYSGKEL